MIKKMYMLTYFMVVFSLFSIGYTGSYFLDIETSSSCSLSAGIWPDCIPYKPTNPNPENNTIGIDLNPTLSIYVSDPNGDAMDVYFYNAVDNILIDTVTNIESNTTTSVIWYGLDYGVTYEWYAIAEDYEGPTQSDTWRFTTNYPPDIPSLTFPANDSADVVLLPTLKVQAFDPDGDAMTVSFYDASNNQCIGQDVNIVDGENASITWSGLSDSHTYTWYVIVNDSMIETQSDTWSFTTKSRPSGGGSNPPSNNPPTAGAGGPYSSFVDIPITFDGSSSTDSDGTITNYTWDFGDNQNGTGVSPIHTYTEVGIYNVTLTVTDNGGLTDTNTIKATITALLEINNVIATPSIQTIDEYVNITCTITNTSRLVDVILNISYPNNNSTTPSIYQNNIENSTTYYFNQTYNLLGIYEYYIWAYDIENHTTISETYQFSIATDIAPPEIFNVSVTPEEQKINGHINITAAVTDNIGVKEAVLNITYPDNSVSNITMACINGTATYYYNSTYPDMGEYTFFILALDINNNTATSNTSYFSILDLQPPEIIDNTPETAYKNETFTFNATVIDNIQVSDVWVDYWYDTGNHTNISMNNTDNVYWEKTIIIPSNFNILQYIIHARDVSNNWNHTEVKSITLSEN